MVTERLRLTGAETDAFDRGSRRALVWNHGTRATLKRQYRRRLRRALKRILRQS